MQPSIQIQFKYPPIREYVSVIIPVEDDVVGLSATLVSLTKQDFGKDHFEILVGNDGGRSEIAKVCKQFGITCFDSAKKIGSYALRNMLMTAAKGDTFAFIDAQTKALPTWLSDGVNQIRKHEYVGGLVEVIADPNIFVSKALLLYQKVMTFDVEEYMRFFQFASTTNLFVTRRLIEKIGGFDRRLFSSGDLEFGKRTAEDDQTVMAYDPQVKVFHLTRDFWHLTFKQKRIAYGHSALGKLYPQRFPWLKNNLPALLLKMVVPPVWMLRRKRVSKLSGKDMWLVFGVHWWIHMAYHFFRVKAILSQR